MFENASSRRGAGGPTAKLSLEPLEDRTTPAVGTTGLNGVALDPVLIAQSGLVDRAYLAEAARLSLLEAWVGTVEATQGSDARFRQFGSQLASREIAFVNQVLPALTAAGIPLQLTQFDLQLINTFPRQSAASLDSQFIGLSTLYTLQSTVLAQAETVLGSSPTVVALAQGELLGIQQEMIAEAALLGSTNGLAMVNLFGGMGSFDSIGVPGLLAAGRATTLGTTAGTAGTRASTGFGPGASFGTSTGFGTTSTAGGSSTGGFGPGASFGTSSGFGPTFGL